MDIIVHILQIHLLLEDGAVVLPSLAVFTEREMYELRTGCYLLRGRLTLKYRAECTDVSLRMLLRKKKISDHKTNQGYLAI